MMRPFFVPIGFRRLPADPGQSDRDTSDLAKRNGAESP